MTTTIERPLLSAEPPVFARTFGVRLVHVSEGRWRVVDATGRALGHLTADATTPERRYRAERFHAPTRSFRDLGAFWSADDAVAALRYSR